MIVTTGFIWILLLSFNHFSGGYISSKSSGISHVSSKGITEGLISEKKEGQDRQKIRIEPAAEVTTKEPPGVDKSHSHLADDHDHDHDGWDHHDDDGHDHDRWDHDHDRHDDDRWENDGEHHDDRDHDNIWP